ncbi:MAG TPA: amino acid permease [Gemmatimonadaceae bacterium]
MTSETQFSPVDTEEQDTRDLERLGYTQRLRRAIGSYTSFALGFSMVSITTGIFTAFTVSLVAIGGVGVWLWIPVSLGVVVIGLVYAHLGARIPISGYAYQWSSRVGNSHIGWFTGWAALLAFVAGTAGVATTFGTVFASDFWSNPTHQNIELLAAIVIVICFVVNVVGVKIATYVNNLGASVELVGTFGIGLITLVGVIFFFDHQQGPSLLFKAQPANGGSFSLTNLGLAALLPIFSLIGWEGCADLAEETKDPRRTTPKTMLQSLILSAIAGFLLFMIFQMAIPYSVSNTVNQSISPLVYILNVQFGHGMGSLFKAIGFIAIVSCLLANMAVATRLLYSLSRDKMLPAHSVLSSVNRTTRTPIGAIVVVALFALVINLLSAGIITRVISIVTICYYLTYMLTLISVGIGDRSGRIPDAPGYFTLRGKSLPVLVGVGILYTAVAIFALTLPSVNHISAEYSGAAMLIGVIWWAVYLRPRLDSNAVGPHRNTPGPVQAAPSIEGG